MGRPGYITVPILSVLAAIGYVYYTTVFLAIPAWLGLSSATGLANAAVFSALAAACVATYAVAVSRDPGRVPASFVPDVEDAGSPIHEIKRKGGDLRYCQKCSHYKPPRAHHCRACKRCVLRMDHHCIWINNCVGHENYKIFLVFVMYAVIASFYSMGVLCIYLKMNNQAVILLEHL
uniref:S-acyltransferase n=1 Tax=Zea mays TaxID=4577 RepID=C0PA56_MAIZE|nr:unknown [Zea mays]